MPTEERYVVVSVFTTLAEADLARVALQGIGIDSHLADGETVAMDWILSNAVGGVKVLVRESDAVKATQYLTRRRSLANVDDYGLERPSGRRRSDEDEEDDDAEEPESPETEADRAVERAWKAAILGLVFCPGVLHVWSLAILWSLPSQGAGISPGKRGQYKMALAVDLVVALIAFALLLSCIGPGIFRGGR